MTTIEPWAAPLATRATFSDTSMALDPDTPYEEWAAIGVTLRRIGDGVCWWIADWLLFGERVYGETYAQAINDTGLAYQTLANYASVGKRIPPSRRRKNLSFAHHAEVAYMEPEEQREWLDRAHERGWKRNELRAAIRGEDPDQVEAKSHTCPNCGHTFVEYAPHM